MELTTALIMVSKKHYLNTLKAKRKIKRNKANLAHEAPTSWAQDMEQSSNKAFFSKIQLKDFSR